jgi:hypothetical protein
LVSRVVAVAGEAVHLNRFQQANFVIVVQGLHCDKAEPGEIADFEHLILWFLFTLKFFGYSIDPPVSRESIGLSREYKDPLSSGRQGPKERGQQRGVRVNSI